MHSGLGSFHFARRYSGNHIRFLFLQVLRCFTSPRSLLIAYVFSYQLTPHNQSRVPPFGHRRISVCLPLPDAFRSLPRPSSPIRAKASFVCPYLLSLNFVLPKSFPQAGSCKKLRRLDLNLSNETFSSHNLVKELSRFSPESVVELSGIEPLTPCLQGRCSPS